MHAPGKHAIIPETHAHAHTPAVCLNATMTHWDYIFNPNSDWIPQRENSSTCKSSESSRKLWMSSGELVLNRYLTQHWNNVAVEEVVEVEVKEETGAQLQSLDRCSFRHWAVMKGLQDPPELSVCPRCPNNCSDTETKLPSPPHHTHARARAPLRTTSLSIYSWYTSFVS